MAGGLVLLTGATGLVGFTILEKLLQQGVRIRVAVRNESKFAALEKALERAKLESSGIEHVIVPDMTQDEAFEDAIKGVTYVLHVASPLPQEAEDLDVSIVKPAIMVTTSVLRAVLKSPERSIKKVVITSSVAAVAPGVPKAWDADEVVPDPQGPWTSSFDAYTASKKLALSATRKAIAEDDPYFDIINIMPSFVIGRNGFAESRQDYLAGSNNIALTPLLGRELPDGRPGFACHVDDVAAVHVAALHPEITGHRNFGVNFNGLQGIHWNDAIEIAKRRLPGAIEKKDLPLGGSVATHRTAFDASKTERELGIKFKDFETMVVDAANGYLEAKA